MVARFIQSCPTCGRRIEVRLSLVGRTIACTHCHSEFRAASDFAAADPPTVRPTDPVPTDPLMQRVERVLAESFAPR